ncbi:MAG: carbohydrate kinase family protein [Jatrophihabitans sp.]
MTTGRIVCVGHVMVDVAAQLPGPLAAGSDTPAQIDIRHGGSAANTAAWVASLGVPSMFVGRVGDDEFGRAAVDALRAQRVTTAVTIDPTASTGMCIVLVAPDGERTMIPSAGANSHLSEADLPTLDGTDRLHVSGYALLDDGSQSAALAAIDSAVRAGAAVSVDAASAAPLRRFGPTEFRRLLPASTLLVANADEATALTGLLSPTAAAGALAEQFDTVVVKRGGTGAVAVISGAVYDVPGVAASVRDSTGAGDAFAAGLLAALRAGADLATAVTQAHRLGAVAVSQLGARPLG